jgi:hypothetical protein
MDVSIYPFAFLLSISQKKGGFILQPPLNDDSLTPDISQHIPPGEDFLFQFFRKPALKSSHYSI